MFGVEGVNTDAFGGCIFVDGDNLVPEVLETGHVVDYLLCVHWLRPCCLGIGGGHCLGSRLFWPSAGDYGVDAGYEKKCEGRGAG